MDINGDGLPDSWENLYSFDPNNPDDATADSDNDSYSNLNEYLHGSEPNNASSIPTSNTTIRVPAEAPNISTAINWSIDGDTILVADGIYGGYCGYGNCNISFQGKAIIVRSEKGPENCIIDCGNSGRGFIFNNNEDANSVLNGFTITNGYKEGWAFPPNRTLDSGGGGITFAPQSNRVFGELSVMENLEIGGYQLPRKKFSQRLEHVLNMFPVLRQRSNQTAGRLSGGEQQMLAIARAMIPEPKLLMLDEPSLGLSPNLVKDVFKKISEICKETGIGILIVEQKVHDVLEIADRVYSMKLGKIAFEGAPDELRGDKTKLRQLFL